GPGPPSQLPPGGKLDPARPPRRGQGTHGRLSSLQSPLQSARLRLHQRIGTKHLDPLLPGLGLLGDAGRLLAGELIAHSEEIVPPTDGYRLPAAGPPGRTPPPPCRGIVPGSPL